METIRIQFTLFSAFYSPLISTMSGGFLKAEGLDAEWSVSPPGVSALAALKDGSAHVVQSALSQGFTSLDKGETPEAVHFAQVNEMDGFFLTGRQADPAFTWKKLEGAEVVTFKGGQPQGGPKIGPCGFSSLAATREWLGTEMAKAFMRAYRKTRVYMNKAPAAEIARAEKAYFPDIDEKVLADCIATYQQLGCWTPHVEITREAYERTLDVFEYNGLAKRRYRYEQVCAAPPATD